MKIRQISGTKFFLVNRKPTICPQCGEKKVRKAILGYPTEEDYYNDKIYCIGCIPDFSRISESKTTKTVLFFQLKLVSSGSILLSPDL